MTLDEYLESKSISVADFAVKIGAKSRATVHRYLAKDKDGRPKKPRVPNPDMMSAIKRVTEGLVVADSFYPNPKKKHKRRISKESAAVNAI